MTLKELHNIKLENKQIYIDAFKALLKNIKSDNFNFKNEINENYEILNEQRLNSHFVHIVPNQLRSLFKKIQVSNPNDFLGLTILVSKKDNLEVRISCFGIPCSELTRTII